MEVDEHVFLVHHVSNVRFLIIVGFPAGTNDVRRRRPRQTPLSRRNTRRCTRRPRTTSTHARLFQEAGPLIPLPSQGNHPLRCIQPATALQFDSHQSSLFDSVPSTFLFLDDASHRNWTPFGKGAAQRSKVFLSAWTKTPSPNRTGFSNFLSSRMIFEQPNPTS